MVDQFVDVPGPQVQELRDDVVKHANHVVSTEDELAFVRQKIDKTKKALEDEYDMPWEQLRTSDIDDKAIERLKELEERITTLESRMPQMWDSLLIRLTVRGADLSKEEVRDHVERGTLGTVLDSND